MNATNMNGKARTSLASQIDRLDAVLDGLAAGLNDAVASAVKEAVALTVREAIQAVTTELASNPTLLRHLGATAVPSTNGTDDLTTTATTQPKVGLRTKLAGVKSWIGRQVQTIGVACRSVLATMLAAVTVATLRMCQVCVTVQRATAWFVCATWRRLQFAGHYLVRGLTAFATGLATGVAATCFQPYVVLAIAAMAGVLVGWMAPMVLWRRTSATS